MTINLNLKLHPNDTEINESHIDCLRQHFGPINQAIAAHSTEPIEIPITNVGKISFAAVKHGE